MVAACQTLLEYSNTTVVLRYDSDALLYTAPESEVPNTATTSIIHLTMLNHCFWLPLLFAVHAAANFPENLGFAILEALSDVGIFLGETHWPVAWSVVPDASPPP